MKKENWFERNSKVLAGILIFVCVFLFLLLMTAINMREECQNELGTTIEILNENNLGINITQRKMLFNTDRKYVEEFTCYAEDS